MHECVGSSEEDEGYIDARQVSSNHARDRYREVGGYEGGNRFSIIIMEFIFAARCSSVVTYFQFLLSPFARLVICGLDAIISKNVSHFQERRSRRKKHKN